MKNQSQVKYIIFVSIFLLGLPASSYSYDYIKGLSIMTKEDSCKMYREFDLTECEKQAATVKDAFNKPRCKMWARERESMLLDCDGKSERAKMEERHNKRRIELQKNATHLLVEKGRLICLNEKSLRETINSIINQEPGVPRYIHSKVCSILDYETIVKINSTSKDGKVIDIDYMDKYASVRHGFTSPNWVVTKQKYQEIKKKRQESLM